MKYLFGAALGLFVGWTVLWMTESMPYPPFRKLGWKVMWLAWCAMLGAAVVL